MAAVLKLEPESAALSIATKLGTMQQLRTAIKETVIRYDGLKSFDAELEKHGVKDEVAKLMAEALNPEPAQGTSRIS